MVKGVSKQVIVVRSPDPRVFDEAIFIVSDTAMSKKGVSPDDILREAQEVASDYLKTNVPSKLPFLRRVPSVAWLSIGAALTGLAWAIVEVF